MEIRGVNCQCVFVCVKGATRETQNSPLKKGVGGLRLVSGGRVEKAEAWSVLSKWSQL